tara:strand:- start:349 stop:759 length:411 start_codon:yes stop_codon:yes gene_type:complete
MGRPRKYKNRTIYQLGIEKEDLDAFIEIAKRETGQDACDIIQDLIKKYNKAHGKGNPCFSITKWSEDPEFKAFPTLGEKPDRKMIEKMSDKEILELASKVRSYVNALKDRVREADWKWNWGGERRRDIDVQVYEEK